MEIKTLEALLSQPIKLSVSLEEAETQKALKEELNKLKAEYNKLMFNYKNCTEIIAKFRQFCQDEEIELPRHLSFITPWEGGN